ncbi:uncharacterized protein LOC126369341 [Pectinophora gossypiella]|nr:uncharacterized protein LOC126369341 [Pectinophora gossypiella]
MGKRKRERDDDYDYIKKKMKKLERKLKKARKNHSDTSSTSSRNAPSIEEDGPPIVGNNYDIISSEEEVLESSRSNLPSNNEVGDTLPLLTTASDDEPLPSTSAGTAPAPADLPNELLPGPELNDEILAILGDDLSVVKEYGNDIQADLALRLKHLLTQGMPKEIRKELHDRYLPPGNCNCVGAPELNLEVKAAIPDVIYKRDRSIQAKQKQVGCAISCISEALTILLSRENKDTQIIKLLMDGSRLLCDCQHADSVTRRNFVLNNIKKDIREHLVKSKIDKFLFGSDVVEVIKTAKSISKSGADLKSVPTTSTIKSTQPAKNKQNPGPSRQHTRNNLNWKAPPPGRRQQGTQRAKEPAQRNQHANSSRPSQRAPAQASQTNYNRR